MNYFSLPALRLINDYLTNRNQKQKLRILAVHGIFGMLDIFGISEGSVLGPLLVNGFFS